MRSLSSMSLPTSDRVNDDTASDSRESSSHGVPSGPGLILSSAARSRPSRIGSRKVVTLGDSWIRL